MALEKLAKVPSLVRKAGQAASKAQPFYSPVDQAIANIMQGKGTGAQMLAELMKTKGVAKELKDRPAIKKALEANKESKVTKADLERLAAENPVAAVQEMTIGDSNAKHQKWTIPGGENYRELLIKLPANSSQNYRSTHFEEPNILAHARVSDRVGSNGEKILHVEEVQSDWHQAARDARKNEIKRLMEAEGIDKATASKRVPENFGYAQPETKRIKGVAQPDEQGGYKVVWEDGTFSGGYSKEGAEAKALEGKSNATSGVVPDAPFKQNWHELVMKRLLDDAARNGYDKVVITPGAEQAKRYNLSKHINNLQYDELGDLRAFDKEGRMVISQNVAPENLNEFVGEELADKLRLNREKRLEAKKVYREFLKSDAPNEEVDVLYKDYLSHPTEYSGLDLEVGGEGMKGFYDQILPSYLNDYGKRYGVQVGTYDMPVGEKMIPDRAGLGMIRSGEQEVVPFHSFDITPQMREEITGKGLPLYQAAPVAIGAGAMQEEQPTEYAKGGTVKNVLKAVLPKGQQAVLPAAESAANLNKFLADSAIKDRLYHATPKSFNEFIPGGDNPLRSGPAVWMTPNKFEQPAAHNIRAVPDKPGYMYGNASGKFTPGTNVMPLYSSIKNPLYSSETTWKQDFEKFGGSPWTLEPSNIQSMKSAGFDGIVYRDKNGDIAEVVAFEPTQIKSAIGNRGTYDIEEADINKAKGGRVTNDAMWMAVQNKQLRKKHGN
jgi:hypothetical protein